MKQLLFSFAILTGYLCFGFSLQAQNVTHIRCGPEYYISPHGEGCGAEVRGCLHPRGGGFVADTATVDDDSTIGGNSAVCGTSTVSNSALGGSSLVSNSQVDTSILHSGVVSDSEVSHSRIMNAEVDRESRVSNSVISDGSLRRSIMTYSSFSGYHLGNYTDDSTGVGVKKIDGVFGLPTRK